MDKYKIKDYTERLKKETHDNAHKMIYMWIKQGVITLTEYQCLVKNLTILDVSILSELKDWCYDNCNESNSDRLNEIIDRLDKC